MSLREKIHQLVDSIPDDQLAITLHKLQDADDESLNSDDLAAVDRGLDDLRAGRSITIDDLKKKYGL